MENTLEDINIAKLVEDIKSGEAAHRRSSWDIWCKKRGLGRTHSAGGKFYPEEYAGHMTKLYTLRAWLRRRMHRKNPPASIRDYNRSMEDSGSPRRMDWDMAEHNWKIAEAMSQRYELEEEAAA